MSLSDKFKKACLQILREDDLAIPSYIEDELKSTPLSAEFIEDADGRLYLKLYSLSSLMLTEVVPLLKNIGINIYNEVSYKVDEPEYKIFVNRYRIENGESCKIKKHKKNILSLIKQMLSSSTLPNTPILQMTLLENLSPREIKLLYALVEYENQLVLSFNKATITKVLILYHEITKKLISFFKLKFDPTVSKRELQLRKNEVEILNSLQPVTHITEDLILKTLFEIVKATVRTNYFLNKESISLKIHTKKIESKLKGTQPTIEAFVYCNLFSGVHMRMGKVSRGGIRWSDRFEDYRDEIKSLMLTQEGKNAIIIPRGAKGGFIIKKAKDKVRKDELIRFYKMYIDALLDLVDNKEKNKIVPAKEIVKYDDDDTYFVVAADKGTAHMSDEANSVAIARNFWMQDAFASGGSSGYNHKELGITAKGAIRSVERHFIEKGVNIYETPITVIGIGSMNGDVFGNGMLLSKKFKLVAAVSHKEIFIDPNPDPLISWKERKRLFEDTPNGGWGFYDKGKISKGGGVFKREEKEIFLSNEIKELIKTKRKSMSAEEVVQAVLTIKADLLFNGGVGTYVKASWESNLDVGDKENENVRVDASDLKVGAVCEGGNLGLTLPARIEYAINGGFINLDAIDNSAGVNISDYEVNLKIALHSLILKGQMDQDSKNEVLKKQTDMVVNRVLWANYHQSLAISLEYIKSIEDKSGFLKAISVLEKELPIFSRKKFHIPKDDNIEKILDKKNGIARPILATLLSYSKLFTKEALLKSDFLKESFAQEYLLKYFPKTFATIYEDEILSHPLKREICATVIANRVINYAGITFLSDFNSLGASRFILKIKSYLICNQLFGFNDARYEIFRQDYKIETQKAYSMLLKIESTIAFCVNWMMRHMTKEQIDATSILRYKNDIANLIEELSATNKNSFKEFSDHIARSFTALPYLKFIFAAIVLHEKSHRPLDEVAKLIFSIIDSLFINDILAALEEYRPKNEKESTIRNQLKEFIEFSVTSLAEKVVHYRKDETVQEALKRYLDENSKRHKALSDSFESFNKETEKSIEEIALLVNTLLQITLEKPN